MKGEAARVLCGSTASLDAILHKFDPVYGSVQMEHLILASFYSSKQVQHDGVSAFSNRIVDLLNKAIEQEAAI